MNHLPLLGVFCGLLLPGAAAWPLASVLCRRGRTGWLPWLVAVPLGYGLLTIGLFLLNLLGGFRLWLGSGAAILAGLLVGGLWARRQRGTAPGMAATLETRSGAGGEWRLFSPRWERVALCVVVGVAAGLWAERGVLALSAPLGLENIPGMGVWGYKARALAESGQIPWEVLGDRERPYLNQSYPLGYPLLLAWGHWCAGGFDDQAVALLPYLSGLLVFLLLAVMLREAGLASWLALGLALAPFSGGVFDYCVETLYAETTLLLFLVPGVWLIQRYLRERAAVDLWLGVLLLAMASWIKQEGMLYLALVLAWLAVDGWRRRGMRGTAGLGSGDGGGHEAGAPAAPAALSCRHPVSLLLTAALFVVPWGCCRWATGVPLYDFALARPWEAGFAETLRVLGMGWRQGAAWIFLEVQASGGLWLVAAALLVGRLARSPRRGCGIGFAWYCALVPAAVFMSLYVFSVRELAWHLDSSLPRLLLVAGMCALTLGAGVQRIRS